MPRWVASPPLGAVPVALLAGLLAWFAGCAPEDGAGPVELDLLQVFPFTESGQEVDVIDLGTPAADAHLLTGWSERDRLPTGESVAWTAGRRAAIQFVLREPAERRVVLRCGVPAAAGRPFPVTVSLNSRRAASLRLRGELEDHVVTLPAPLQRAGPNELELLNPLGFRSGSPRARPLARAVACDVIRFETPHPNGGRPRLADTDALLIPARARVDFFLRVPRASEVAFGLLPSAGARLRLSVQRESEAERTLFSGGADAGPTRFDLTDYQSEVAKLSFEATGDGAVRVVRPRLLGKAAPVADKRVRREESRPNVLLYVVDTLRADHLGCYGYPRPTSPHIDALVADGVLFAHTVAQSAWTTPATASILTGRYPIRHGALALWEGMRPDVPTLAEILRGQGYRTAAFVTNANVRRDLGFGRGFDEYRYVPEKQSRPTVHLPANELHELVLSWLEQGNGRPFFVYVHASDPHGPYTPPSRFAERFRAAGPAPSHAEESDPLRAMARDAALRTPANVDYLASLYDAEIAFTDESFGELLEALKRRGLYQESLIVFTADHGEEFYDHGGFEHGRTLYREQTSVPLVLRLPAGRRAGERVASLARQIDVLPTLLDFLGVETPADVDGRPLLPGAQGETTREVEAFSHTRFGVAQVAAVVTPPWKVIHRRAPRPDRFEVYNVRDDPAEQNDLAAKAPVVLGYGRQLLAQWSTRIPRQAYQPGVAPGAPAPGRKTRERLRALGYVN